MKRVLSLVLALVMVLGMIPMGFAADQTAGEILKGYKIIEGYEDGSLGEDNHLNRAEMMVVLARMMGKGEEAKAFALPSSFTDLEGFGWAVPWIAYAELNEWTAGVGAGKFNPAGEVTLQEAAVFMLKALGYVADTDFTWANAVEVATAKSLLAGVSVAHTNAVKRGELFTVMINTLNTNVKDGSATLGVKLGYMKPAILAVESVVAMNLKQVKVAFNMAVTKAIAEDEANYKVYNASSTTDLLSTGTAELQADGKTVILTLATPFNNGTTGKVVIKNIVEYTNDAVAVVDNTIPTVVGIAVTGPKTFTVEYSEPVTSIDPNEYTVDEGNYIVANAVANGSNKVDVTVGVNFTNGEHKVKFNGTNVADYAGYKVVPTTKTFIVAADTTAPTVTVSSVTPTQIKLVFNKPVTGVNDSNVKYRHTFNNDTYFSLGNAAGFVTAVSSTEYTLDFTGKPIGLGSNNLYISYVSSTGTKIEDLWGNDFVATTLPLNVQLDTVKPAVKEIKFVDAQTIKVIFTEEVDLATSQTAANYTIKDAAGDKVAVTLATRGGADKNEVTLAFAANALGGGAYTITVEKVKDVAFVANTMEIYTSSLNINDTVRPTVVSASWAVSGTNEAKVYISFSEKMDVATLVKNNFSVTINGGTPRLLGDDDTVTIAGDAKSVVLKVAHTATVTSMEVTVGAVRDAAGNGFAGFVVALTGTSSPAISNDSVAVEKVEAIGTKTLKVTFDGRLSTVSATGFSLAKPDGTASGIAMSVTSHVVDPDTNKSIVEFSLGSELTADAKFFATPSILDLVVNGATGTKSYLGTQVSNFAANAAVDKNDVKDKIVPSVSTVVFVDADTIEVTFTEALNAATFAATLNGFSVANGGELLSVSLDVTGKVVVLTAKNSTDKAFVDNTTTVSYNSVAGLTDLNANKLASFSDKVAE